MKCPGQDMQYWTEGAIFEVDCPKCGTPVEFYKDDTSRKCGQCGNRFVNPKMDFGCASYCQYAEQCLGTLPDEFVGQQDNLLKDKVAVEVKRYYKSDFQRIGHATRVARYAEKIGMQEGGNLAVILCAAYLHDIGTTIAAKKVESPSQADIGQESLIIAKEILAKLQAKSGISEDVCDLISHQNDSEALDSIEFKVISDAEQLAIWEEQHKANPFDPAQVEQLAINELSTDAGRQEAREQLSAKF